MDPVNILAKFKVRSFIRSWDNRGYSKNLGSFCICPRSIFSQSFNRLLFARTIWIYLPNLTFVALPIPELIGGTSKSWGVSRFAHAPYSPKFLKGFCSHGPCEYTCQIWSSYFFCSWDNRGTQRIWAVPVYAHAPVSPKFLIGFCSYGPSEYICQIWSS